QHPETLPQPSQCQRTRYIHPEIPMTQTIQPSIYLRCPETSGRSQKPKIPGRHEILDESKANRTKGTCEWEHPWLFQARRQGSKSTDRYPKLQAQRLGSAPLASATSRRLLQPSTHFDERNRPN